MKHYRFKQPNLDHLQKKGYLPHFDDNKTTHVVTFSLADSFSYPPDTKLKAKTTGFSVVDSSLDKGWGNCILAQAVVSKFVEQTLLHFNRERYELFAWVIMPNHVHVLFTLKGDFPLWRIVQAWKSFSAKQVNRHLGTKGVVWSPDFLDRCVRDKNHFVTAWRYIENNPVKAKLCRRPDGWRFSSAWRGPAKGQDAGGDARAFFPCTNSP